MPTVPSQLTNQFEQTPAIGQTDLGIARGSGVIAMQISANEAGTLNVGSRVKLDSAVTTPMGFPQVVAAADNEDGIGIILRTVKSSQLTKGAVIEVGTQLGLVTFQVAAATIAAGAKVEMASGFVQTKAAGSTFGIALDPGVLNGFLRVGLLMPLQA